MPWAFVGGPVDVGHGRFGRLDADGCRDVRDDAEKSARVTFGSEGPHSSCLPRHLPPRVH